MDVEIVIDAISDHPIYIEVRGVAGVDVFAVHHELHFAALRLDAELVRGATARVCLRDRVAGGPFDDRDRAAGITGAPANRVHPVDRPHQEVRIALPGVREALAADEDAKCFGMGGVLDRKSTRLNSSHLVISYAVFCLKKKKKTE